MTDKPKIVLLIEDEALMRMALSSSLASAGLTVVEVASGEEALRLLQEGLTPALVITDVRLAGALDGLAVVKWLATQRPTVPVIVASGYLLPSELREDAGNIAAIYEKPYDPDELTRKATSLVVRDIQEA